LLVAILFALCLDRSSAQRPPNANAVYQQLRGLLPGADVITVENLELHRDAATFTFKHGDFAFYGEVNGKITGAVFKGDGHFRLKPPTAEERHNLNILNHSEVFDEDFSEVVLRFTDSTAAELHKAATGKGQPDNGFFDAARDFHNYQRLKLGENFDLRLLEDVLSPAPGGYFLAAIHGKKDPHLIYRIDPNGATDVSPEEVSLLNMNDWGPTYLSAFHLASEGENWDSNEQNAGNRIDHEDLEVSMEKSGFLTGLATVHLLALQDGVVVVPLNLYPTLRVSQVVTDKGDQLDYVQEKKEEDSDFGVILPKPLKKGESATIRVSYGGKDVVSNEGGSNYYPVARESWYPNSARGLGDYATYHMVFHVPKGLELIATGTRLSENSDGKTTTTEWKTDVPLPVVGFNIGKFTMKEAIVEQKMSDNLIIDAYANTSPPDMLAHTDQLSDLPIQDRGANVDANPIGNINTAGMLPVELSQGQVAAKIYTAYFGQLPFAKVALTQQFACNYGQSWPMLVYLPICGFLDQTQQHFLGLQPENMYWKIVTPHEVAHQWWGQTVGFRSYRDQWMSEGFANTSASIFLQATRPKPDDFHAFWREQRKLITEKNAFGFRPIDVGPVTMGFRLSTQKTGYDIYQNLVYPKGAYILHMIRMMMWSPKEGDGRFIDTMHDFVATYRLQAATTENFKAIVEKHMSPGMDLEGNHRMDWFFREYVYGTDLPTYHFESQLTPSGDSQTVHFKLTQSGVAPDFRMMVPMYLEFEDGKVMRLGSITIIGDMSVDKTVQLPKMQSPVKKVTLNYNYDVLCIEN
jgi:hypothetical protein